MNHVYNTAMLADACLYHSGEPCLTCVEYWAQVWAERAEEEMLRPRANQNGDVFNIKGGAAVGYVVDTAGSDLVFKSGSK